MSSIDPTSEEYLRQVHVVEPTVLTGHIEIADYNPAWPRWFQVEADRIAEALGEAALTIEHVGSTSVPGLAAKPVIDIDLIVVDSAAEADYVPQLEAAGYVLHVREPDWYEHRLFKAPETSINLHVFGPEAEEHRRHLIFRDHLRVNAGDRERYAQTKRELARGRWKYMTQYADAKSEVILDILDRAGYVRPAEDRVP